MKKLAYYILFGAALFASAPIFGQAKYDFSKLKMENLGRGVVAVRQNPEEVTVSWRYLESDPENQAFDVYRNGKKVNSKPITNTTYFIDKNKEAGEAVYSIKPIKGGKEGS